MKSYYLLLLIFSISMPAISQTYIVDRYENPTPDKPKIIKRTHHYVNQKYESIKNKKGNIIYWDATIWIGTDSVYTTQHLYSYYRLKTRDDALKHLDRDYEYIYKNQDSIFKNL